MNGTISNQPDFAQQETDNKKKEATSQWERIFANNSSHKGLIPKLYKELINSTLTNNTIRTWAENLNRYFSQEGRQTSNRHMKRWSTPPAVTEMQITSTMRHHLSPFRMAMIHKTRDKCWRGCGKGGTLIHCWWEYRLL